MVALMHGAAETHRHAWANERPVGIGQLAHSSRDEGLDVAGD